MDAIEAQPDSESDIDVAEIQRPLPDDASTLSDQPSSLLIPDKRWKWWILVVLNIFFLLLGQAVAVILGKFYFDHGGHTIDNYLYTLGLWYLPVTTYSLICASQLIFNVIFSVTINSEKLTFLILKSVILITVSASLVAIHPDSSEQDEHGKHARRKKDHVIGFLCTVGASAGYALLLSLTQFSFDKVLKKETFGVVFEMQIYTSLVSTFVCIVGLFASSEWKTLGSEMETFKLTFKNGELVYVLSLVGSALGWQICTVGVVGLIYLVSSSPMLSQYLDDNKAKKEETDSDSGIKDFRLDGISDKLV
ncbi:hypothetical protein CCACVL1_16556 [Corchorus capsularis]|uniref:Probable purine permease n=1 Tax=Corchorus capsularis TaxID=210143 RepID=A0A1R3HWA6_COCAP|nr:hypothetical protein CCACVL1_16556 [Corchorus capsularis]